MKVHANQKIPWSDLGLIYLVHQFIVLSSCYFGQNMLAGKKAPLELWAALGKGLSHWDGKWYLQIATEGYNLKSVAFFPLYPLLIKALTSLGLAPQLAGLLISNVAFLLLLLIFERLISLDYDSSVALRSCWYLSLFPTSFYFSVLYTEALFLLLVLWAFYLMRTNQWVLASVVAMFASLTRSLGVLLIFPLLWEYYQAQFRTSSDRSLPKHYQILSCLLIPAGLGCYMLYLQLVFGNPLAFLEAQRFWKRSFDWPWNSIYHATLKITEGNNFWNLTFTIFAMVMLVIAYRQLRPSYTLYMLFGLIMPLFSPAYHSPLLSMPRFTLVLFPSFLVLARLVKREQTHWTLLSISSVLLVFLTMLFTNSRWVA